MKSFFPARLALAAMAALVVAIGCSRKPSASYQGYLEGEFVYVGAPLAGRLETLAVRKGAEVGAGQMLFTLENAAEQATQREAANRLRSAQARLTDLKKGLRPSELAALEARLEQARAAAELSKRELARQESLFQTGALAASELDRARITHERNSSAIAELTAQLATARIGGRVDAVAAAESEVAAAQAAKERADWAVDQKTQTAPAAALVYDTLFRPGEFVPAGAPVVALLPPANLKVRFFVPEAAFATLAIGDRVRVAFTAGEPLEARINYVSPRPEYTPPVLYNRDNRSKLVFMAEAVFTSDTKRALHPGLPVDVYRIQ